MTQQDIEQKAREIVAELRGIRSGNDYVRSNLAAAANLIESLRQKIAEKDAEIKKAFVIEAMKEQASKALGDAMTIIKEKDEQLSVARAEIERLQSMAIGGEALREKNRHLQSRVKELEEQRDKVRMHITACSKANKHSCVFYD